MKKLNLLLISLSLLTFKATLLDGAVMPDLKGIPVDSAKTLFKMDTSVIFTVLSDSFYTDSIPVGAIAWQYPLPDSIVTDSIAVRPAAPLNIKMPDLIGMNMNDVAALLVSMGLEFLPTGQVESDKYPKGAVVVTSPEAGTTIERKSTIYAKVSVGKPDYTYTTTKEGTPINLYEDPTFKITSVSLASSDSSGFVLSFNIQVTNPYKHSFTAESFNYLFMINDTRYAKNSANTSIKLSSGATSSGKILVPISYASLKPSTANLLLEKGRYRLYGTFSIIVESGFSQKDFDARGEFQPFLNSSSVKTRLEEIASSK